MLQSIVLFSFPSLMAYAASSDLLTMTISNWVSVILVGAFLWVASLAGMSIAAVHGLTFGLFAFGWIGGGDAKLAAATAVWLGWDNLYAYGLNASIAGGAITLLILYWRKVDLPAALYRRAWIKRLHAAGTGVPYGIALAIAGLSLYPDTSVWSAAAGI